MEHVMKCYKRIYSYDWLNFNRCNGDTSSQIRDIVAVLVLFKVITVQ